MCDLPSLIYITAECINAITKEFGQSSNNKKMSSLSFSYISPNAAILPKNGLGKRER